MEQYLIVCPLIFLAGLIDSIGGGGGLISLPAYLIAGVPPHAALATNKLGSTMGTVVSTGRFIKNGYVDFKTAAPAAVASVAGAFLGARLSLHVDESVIRHMMLVILPVVAFYVLKNKNLGDEERTKSISYRRQRITTVAIALALGLYDGFYGPGTGTFLLLLLTGAASMDMKRAAGITKVLNLSSNISALITFVFSGKVYYSLGLAAGLFCIAGHYIGSGMVMSGGKRVVRPLILVVLGLLFGKVISEVV
ncbi:TSUP family transporter [Lachnospiraceae bacterium 62-35]